MKFLNVFFKKKHKHKFLFILSPPYSGSTLLNEIISLSDNVSSNNEEGTREGQTLPTVRKIMFENKEKWNPSYEMNWSFIKKEWMKHWDLNKVILLEKSPPNIVRAYQIQNCFSNSYFIILYRNPYALCEGLVRRDANLNDYTLAAKYAIKYLEYQRKNLESLVQTFAVSYEELTNTPHKFTERLSLFLPELQDINTKGIHFKANNYHNQKLKITNLNELKIKKLKAKDLEKITLVLKEHQSLLDFFGYEILKS